MCIWKFIWIVLEPFSLKTSIVSAWWVRFSLVFVVRDAKGMVEGTCNGWVGAGHPWPPPKVGEVAEGRSTESAPEAQPVSHFQGDTHSR